MRSRVTLLALLSLVVAVEASAAGVRLAENFKQEYPLDISGSFWIDNPVGDVEIVGSDLPGLVLSYQKITDGVDRGAVKDAHDLVRVEVGGDQHDRAVRAVFPPVRDPRWRASISFTIRVPRTVHVRITSLYSDHLRVNNISGNVNVKNFSGSVLLDGVVGVVQVESTNGKIIYDCTSRPSVNAQLSTVNNDIEVRVPGDSNFDWVADTIQGDFLTTLPARGRFNGTSFRASVNSPGGPTITTSTLLGRVWLLKRGSNSADAHSLRHTIATQVQAPMTSGATSLATVKLPLVEGNWAYSTPMANISVGEIRGSARVDTGAGDVELGSVYGACTIYSLGGPINLGDILGWLIAHTAAGNVFVRAAREGGNITTEGGSIRLLYTGGLTTLHSGGGDVIVGQASGPIVADTRSGDITITADPNQKTQRIEAKTLQGNVVLNVSPRFGADIDITLLTSNPDTNKVTSDLKGLNIRKEKAGKKTRIRATGKINGGGEKVTLYAEEGDVHLTTRGSSAITVMRPQ